MSATIATLPLDAAAVERIANRRQLALDLALHDGEITEDDYCAGIAEIEAWHGRMTGRRFVEAEGEWWQ